MAWAQSVEFTIACAVPSAANTEQDDKLLLPARHMRVLFADDNAMSRIIIRDMLTDMSFSVTTADSGEAALAKIRTALDARTPYQLIILDWKMPDQDGLETARRIHALLPDGQMPPILLLMAYHKEILDDVPNRDCITDILVKPVSHKTMLAGIKKVLRIAPTAAGPSENDSSAPLRESVFRSIGQASVLLVEDNPINQMVATEILEQCGLRVDAASDGPQALKKARAETYDAVLMDIQMPDMDGFEATRRLRLDPRYIHVPIIAMTANAMKEDREKSLAAGMQEHLSKPFVPHEVVETLIRLIGERRRSAAENAPRGE